MQHVLRCDYEACRQYLVNLEQAFMLDQGSQALGALLDHRCDGNRNILHAAVSVCFPVSNKETKEEEGEVTFKTIMKAYLHYDKLAPVATRRLISEKDLRFTLLFFPQLSIKKVTWFACSSMRLFLMLSVCASFQKLRGLRETHLQSVCRLWRQ